MTSHELAKILLDSPDETVAFWKYTGGYTELMEVEDVTISIDPYPTVVLHTYKQG